MRLASFETSTCTATCMTNKRYILVQYIGTIITERYRVCSHSPCYLHAFSTLCYNLALANLENFP
jgi:hypothetical protein